ncbi:hypothetical protein [Mycolicibacterium grossiae]|uniref:hypothetical protein n=1 Tax=Mycolicibacterium grossiae TaxID=1552759 RepID=UPI000F773EE7|nr:hypothetical protein [Mycolicibacterium grossiae]QEM43586.1 hypothetical protein FZ046_01285 [Mycolicibacterium grossiae]
MRRTIAGCAVLVAGLGQLGIATASAFDDVAFSTCTSTAVPPPDANYDAIATSCCVDQAGTPTLTTYGIGCVAAVVNPAPDYRPVIYMPTRPAPPEEGDGALDELMKQPPLPLP